MSNAARTEPLSGYKVSRACTPEDFAQWFALRERVFRACNAKDEDQFDAICQHVLIKETVHNQLIAGFRFMILPSGAQIKKSYAAQFYDLEKLTSFKKPLLELGRFCTTPDLSDPDVLRVAWAAIAKMVETFEVEMLFGCSSFPGADPEKHAITLNWLGKNHTAPPEFAPKVAADKVARCVPSAALDSATAQRGLPPLLRSYLQLGGWISDHAVIDDDLDTLHVFTGVQIDQIPAHRARVMRKLAEQLPPLDPMLPAL